MSLLFLETSFFVEFPIVLHRVIVCRINFHAAFAGPLEEHAKLEEAGRCCRNGAAEGSPHRRADRTRDRQVMHLTEAIVKTIGVHVIPPSLGLGLRNESKMREVSCTVRSRRSFPLRTPAAPTGDSYRPCSRGTLGAGVIRRPTR